MLLLLRSARLCRPLIRPTHRHHHSESSSAAALRTLKFVPVFVYLLNVCSLQYFLRADIGGQVDQLRLDLVAFGIVRPATPIIFGEGVGTKQDSRELVQPLVVQIDRIL
jgi:hypothetical protein